MARPKIYVCRPLPEKALALLRGRTEMRLWEQNEIPPPREVLLREVADIDGLLSLLTDRVDGELLDRAPRLRVVSNYAVGFDNTDAPAATQRGVLVTNTPGVLTETVADFAMTLILATARRVVEADKYTRANLWRSWGPMLFLGRDVHGGAPGRGLRRPPRPADAGDAPPHRPGAVEDDEAHRRPGEYRPRADRGHPGPGGGAARGADLGRRG